VYDDTGRLKTTTQGLTGKTLTNVYWPGTNRRKTLGDGSQLWTYNYNATTTQLDNIQQAIGSTTPAQYEYYANGSLKFRHAGTWSRVWYDWSPRDRVRQIDHRTGAVGSDTTQQAAVYVYGSDGNIGTYTEWVNSVDSYVHTYVHDKADRLTSETRVANYGGPAFSNQYTYDANGNRTQVVRKVGAGSPVTYPYGAAGNNDQFGTGEGFTLSSYDSDGNPATVTGPSSLSMGLTYDEMGRVKAITGTGASTFRYDGDGRRVERVAGGVTTRFVYDGDQAVIETNGSNAVQVYRLPGVGFVKSGTQYFDQENIQGSVLSTRDTLGTLKSHTQYDAYGLEYSPWESTPGALGTQRFAGQKGYQNDDATGMQLLGARYYLPVLGRFLTQDPIGLEGGLNLYAYCDNSPLLRSDPSGLDPRKKAAIFMGEPEPGPSWMRFGDHEGDALIARGFYDLLTKKGYDVTVYAPDTVDEAKRYLRGVDAVVLIGHGATLISNREHYGGIRLAGGPNEEIGQRHDVRFGVENLYSALHGRRLERLYIFGCGQGEQKKMQWWLKCSSDVWANPGLCSAFCARLYHYPQSTKKK
jgi:RHS repeat-associated protein